MDLSEYVGIPFREHGRDRRGCDCWGLIRLVYAERLGIALQSGAGDYTGVDDDESIAALIHAGERDWTRVDAIDAQPLDVIVMRVRGQPHHFGLVAGDTLMLHTEPGADAHLARYVGVRWAARIEGIYRHPAMRGHGEAAA